jgi:hypothetical protein
MSSPLWVKNLNASAEPKQWIRQRPCVEMVSSTKASNAMMETVLIAMSALIDV